MERISFQEMPKGLYEVMRNGEKYLRECGISHQLIALIKVRSSQINGCGYCLDMHHKDALRVGEKLERLYLLPAWEEAPCFTAEEKAALNFTEVLTKISGSGVNEIAAAYELMSRYYEKEQIANIILAICQINSWNRIAITSGYVPGSYEG